MQISIQVRFKHFAHYPANENEFKDWLSSALGFEINDKYQYYFDTVTKKLKTDFEESKYWKNILNELPEINDKYFSNKGVNLITQSNIPKIKARCLRTLY